MKGLNYASILMLLCSYTAAQAQTTEVPAMATVSSTVAFNRTDEGQVIWRQARRHSVLADSCTTNDGTTGTCLTRFKCMRQAGTVNGYCGTYGVCCETNLQCNMVTRQKRTIIRNPAQLNSDACAYTVEAFSMNVQQLRIDFEQFELPQPVPRQADESMLECQDYFEAGDIKLCGMNSGQHLYMPFNVAAGVDHITLNFHLPTRGTPSSWRLVITQLEGPQPQRRSMNSFSGASNSLQDLRNIFASHHADYELLAPAGCHQYYTETTGSIKSFNYQMALGTSYMPDTNYNICIKSPLSGGMIEYSFSRFSMALQTGDGTGEGYDEACHPTIHTQGRQEDYLLIPQSMLARNVAYQPTYYCGTNDNLIVYASPPYIMHFSSDEWTYDPAQETGFMLTYRLRTSIM